MNGNKGDNMSEVREETKEAEVNYIKEIHNDMVENEKNFYTMAYDFQNGDRVKITIERLSQ